MLGGMNPYTYALAFPEDAIGAKIPDVGTCVPTGTFQTYQEFTLSPIADSVTASNCIGFWFNPSYFGTFQATAFASGIITWAPVVQLNGFTASAGLYDRLRCVSACIRGDFIGNTTADAGLITGLWNLPLFDYDINTPQGAVSMGAPNSIGQAQNSSYSENVPLRNGVRVLYRPSDNSDIEFYGFVNPYTVVTKNPGIGVVVSGAGALTPALHLQLIVNWEGIPANGSTSLVQATESPINQQWMTEAMQWSQKLSDKVRPMYNAATSDSNAFNQHLATATSSAFKGASESMGRKFGDWGVQRLSEAFFNKMNY